MLASNTKNEPANVHLDPAYVELPYGASSCMSPAFERYDDSSDHQQLDTAQLTVREFEFGVLEHAEPVVLPGKRLTSVVSRASRSEVTNSRPSSAATYRALPKKSKGGSSGKSRPQSAGGGRGPVRAVRRPRDDLLQRAQAGKPLSAYRIEDFGGEYKQSSFPARTEYHHTIPRAEETERVLAANLPLPARARAGGRRADLHPYGEEGEGGGDVGSGGSGGDLTAVDPAAIGSPYCTAPLSAQRLAQEVYDAAREAQWSRGLLLAGVPRPARRGAGGGGVPLKVNSTRLRGMLGAICTRASRLTAAERSLVASFMCVDDAKELKVSQAMLAQLADVVRRTDLRWVTKADEEYMRSAAGTASSDDGDGSSSDGGRCSDTSSCSSSSEEEEEAAAAATRRGQLQQKCGTHGGGPQVPTLDTSSAQSGLGPQQQQQQQPGAGGGVGSGTYEGVLKPWEAEEGAVRTPTRGRRGVPSVLTVAMPSPQSTGNGAARFFDRQGQGQGPGGADNASAGGGGVAAARRLRASTGAGGVDGAVAGQRKAKDRLFVRSTAPRRKPRTKEGKRVAKRNKHAGRAGRGGNPTRFGSRRSKRQRPKSGKGRPAPPRPRPLVRPMSASALSRPLERALGVRDAQIVHAASASRLLARSMTAAHERKLKLASVPRKPRPLSAAACRAVAERQQQSEQRRLQRLGRGRPASAAARPRSRGEGTGGVGGAGGRGRPLSATGRNGGKAGGGNEEVWSFRGRLRGHQTEAEQAERAAQAARLRKLQQKVAGPAHGLGSGGRASVGSSGGGGATSPPTRWELSPSSGKHYNNQGPSSSPIPSEGGGEQPSSTQPPSAVVTVRRRVAPVPLRLQPRLGKGQHVPQSPSPTSSSPAPSSPGLAAAAAAGSASSPGLSLSVAAYDPQRSTASGGSGGGSSGGGGGSGDGGSTTPHLSADAPEPNSACDPRIEAYIDALAKSAGAPLSRATVAGLPARKWNCVALSAGASGGGGGGGGRGGSGRSLSRLIPAGLLDISGRTDPTLAKIQATFAERLVVAPEEKRVVYRPH